MSECMIIVWLIVPPLRLYLVLQTYRWARPMCWEVVLFPVWIFCVGGPASFLLSWLWTVTKQALTTQAYNANFTHWPLYIINIPYMAYNRSYIKTGGLPVWPLVWLTKMTSSLSSRESGEELESVSMPSESLLVSSLMLITPPLSTLCLGTFGWRPLGFPVEGQHQHNV